MASPPTLSTRLRLSLREWRGCRRVLRWGLCPECDSSPPLPECVICGGARLYGPTLDRHTRLVWAADYRTMLWDERHAG
jgi:hypothetical protein